MASATRRKLFRVRGDGPVEELFGSFGSSLPGPPFGLAIDGQDRLYAFLGNDPYRHIVRIEEDLSLVPMLHQTYGSLFIAATRVEDFKGMAVTADGTIFAGFQMQFDSPSQVLSVTSDVVKVLPMESRLAPPRSLAVTPGGRIYYEEYGAIWAFDPGGLLTPLIGQGGLGFHGEMGFDSAEAPEPFGVTGLALDAQGRLLAAVPDRGAIFRFDPSECDSGPSPRAVAAVESGAFSPNVHLAAGTLFSIFGVRLGPVEGAGLQLDSQGRVQTNLAGTRVVVNGVEAPILFARSDQVNAIVPFSLDGQGPAEIVVEVEGRLSPVLRSRIAFYGPSLFSHPEPHGSRRFAAMLNEDGTINSAENPAQLGSVVQLFATGAGALAPAGIDGLPAQMLKQVAAPVRVQVAGVDVEVLYAGTAPGLVEGVVQINCRLPASLPGRGSSAGSIRIAVDNSYGDAFLFYFAGD